MLCRFPCAFSVVFAALLGGACAQFDRIDKPTLWNDGLPLSDYPKGLQSVAAKWEPVGAPDKCVDKANEMQGCPLDTLEARRVTYADCETPWILCRCANATMSMDTITERFGWVPVGVRSYVGGLIVSPEPVASASASGDFLNFNGECVVPVFIHESGHTLDQGSSSNMDWIHGIENSTCVADYYSQSNAVENFAQVRQLMTIWKPLMNGCRSQSFTVT
ncbi:hypothetical protein BKA62DRAFT_50392 [Auriculariales sp. MPI-PUGE-AT-0066]|nr:hypothetical protein BKA62DRAFT_50392 [Auriculariales sp. MPI-PUGE-AT-0066]